MVEKKGGLIPEHHGDLNRPSLVYPGGKEAKDVRLAELRAQHANDPRALQQIDVYEGNTDIEYFVKLEELKEAFKSRDTVREAQLRAWFDKYYSDIG